MLGTFATGLLTSTAINAAGPNGLFFGNPALVVAQLIGIVVVAVFAFVGSYVLLRVINIFTPVRVSHKEEYAGLDMSQHGEAAYE